MHIFLTSDHVTPWSRITCHGFVFGFTSCWIFLVSNIDASRWNQKLWLQLVFVVVVALAAVVVRFDSHQTSRFVVSTERHTPHQYPQPYIMSSIFPGLNKSRLSSHLQTFFIILYRETMKAPQLAFFVPAMNPDKNCDCTTMSWW